MDRPPRPSRHPRLRIRSQTPQRENDVRLREIRRQNPHQSANRRENLPKTTPTLRFIREPHTIRDAAVHGDDGQRSPAHAHYAE